MVLGRGYKVSNGEIKYQSAICYRFVVPDSEVKAIKFVFGLTAKQVKEFASNANITTSRLILRWEKM